MVRALAVLAVDPQGLVGMTLRLRAGPVREAAERLLDRLSLPVRRLHPDLSDTQLFGGLNLAATLAEGRAVYDPGLADASALLVLPMAERTEPGLAARLAQLLDGARGHALVLLDEGAEAEEQAPACLRERLAFAADLNHLRHDATAGGLPAPADLDAARRRLPLVRVRDEDPARLAALAAGFGINSLRAPVLALRAARALAALDLRMEVSDTDLSEAAEMIYPSRATCLPAEREHMDEGAGASASRPEEPTGAGDPEGHDPLPDDMMIAAVRACLPHDALDRFQATPAVGGGQAGGGAGAARRGNRRGRPLPSRPGRPDGRARIDVIATLRAAAPWQTLRKSGAGASMTVIVHPGDIRLRRFSDRSDRLILFVVDASGSAAMARLAEAKGAVELLLSQAYARRDQVSLIAFRGRSAEELLPPTRSLVQAKRRLSALPGGGGTPLAAGLQKALSVGIRARDHGLSPVLAVLTDGKANVALDGSGDRQKATDDTRSLAHLLAAQGFPGLLIDISARRTPETATLARDLGARHIALPHADATVISDAVNSAFAV